MRPLAVCLLLLTACGSSPDVEDPPPPPPTITCLVAATSTRGLTVGDGRVCLGTPTTGGDGSLTFRGPPGALRCAITVGGSITGAGTFDCRAGEPIRFSDLRDLDEKPRRHTLVIEGLAELPWLVDTTGPILQFGATTVDADRGSLVVAHRLLSLEPAGLSFLTCSLDGVACQCNAAAATCTQVPAGTHQLIVEARDAFGNLGTLASTHPRMTYGPAEGRAILLGFDLHETNLESTALLRAAVSDVPWRVRGAFDRRIRAVFYQAGKLDLLESAHLQAALAGLVDLERSTPLTRRDTASLASALSGKDVLIVLDQNDPASAAATGEAWASDPTLRDFLDGGGVVVVLDGWRDGPPDGLPLVSQTWMVLGAGDDPILGILSSADNATMGRPWTYIPTDNELLFGLPSELFVGKHVTPADGAVSFRLRSEETARTTYDAAVFGPHVSAVLEKAFPPQSLSFRAVDENVFAVDTYDDAVVQCSLTVVKCANDRGCCPGGALLCACPPFDTASHEFRTPRRTGLYSLEARLLSPRPGRTAHANVVIPEPEIRVEAVGGGEFCFHGTAVDHSPLPAEAFHATVFDGERFVELPIADPARCADSDDVGSFSVCPAAQVRLDVIDADGNHGELMLPAQSGSDCATL